jgi:hypothetical protein
MPNLQLIPRKGRPPLLVEAIKGRFGKGMGRMIIHWVLVKSVTIAPFYWFDLGAGLAVPAMTDAMGKEITAYMATFGN